MRLPGIGIGTSFLRSMGAGYDPDAVAFFDAVVAAGGSLSDTEKDAINFRVRSWKGLDTTYNPTAIDFWSLGIADYPMVGGTASSCKFNLFNPVDSDGAYRLTFSGSNTFSATGWLGGANGYADTHLKPSDHTNSFFGSAYDRTNVWTNGRYWFGAYDGSSLTWLSYADTQFVYINTTGTGVIAGPINDIGDISCSRTAANDVRGFSNGVQQNGTQAGADSTGTNSNIYLQACSGFLAGGYAQKEFGSASFFSGLTAAQVLVKKNIEQQFQTLLNRNV